MALPPGLVSLACVGARGSRVLELSPNQRDRPGVGGPARRGVVWRALGGCLELEEVG